MSANSESGLSAHCENYDELLAHKKMAHLTMDESLLLTLNNAPSLE